MQIAGRRCRNCDQPIVLASEGKTCPYCDFVTHSQCEAAANCSTCGRPFESYLASEPEPSSAYDPFAERSNRSIGPLLAAFLSTLAILLAYYLMTLT